MANVDAASLAMALEIRRKNKRKAASPDVEVTSELIEEPIDEFDAADQEPVAVVATPSRTVGPEDARNIARAIMLKHKAPVAAEDEFDALDEPKPAVKSSSERIAAILARGK